MDENKTKSKFQISNFKFQISAKLAPGLSLIELLTSMAVLGVVSIMVASVYLASFKLFSNQTTAVDISSQNTIGIDEIANQVKESTGVIDLVVCGGGFICIFNEESNTYKLVLSLWPLDENGKPVDPAIVNANDYVVYSQPSGTDVIEKTIITQTADMGSFRSARAPSPDSEVCVNYNPMEICRPIRKIAASVAVNGLSFRYFSSTGSEDTTAPYAGAAQVMITLKTRKNTIPPNATPLELTQVKKAVLRNKQG